MQQLYVNICVGVYPRTHTPLHNHVKQESCYTSSMDIYHRTQPFIMAKKKNNKKKKEGKKS